MEIVFVIHAASHHPADCRVVDCRPAPAASMLLRASRPAPRTALLLLRSAAARSLSSSPEATLIAELAAQQQAAAAREVPWFLANMPSSYFRQVEPALRAKHLQAITAVCSEGYDVPDIGLRDGGEFTFLSSESDVSSKSKTSAVARELASLPEGAELQNVRLFSSKDGRLGLHLFSTAAEGEDTARFAFSTPEEKEAEERLSTYLGELLGGQYTHEAGSRHAPPTSGLNKASLDAFLRRCPSEYVTSHVPRLLLKQRHLCERVAGTDDVAVDLEPLAARAELGEEESTLLTLASKGMSARAALRRVLALLDVHGDAYAWRRTRRCPERRRWLPAALAGCLACCRSRCAPPRVLPTHLCQG